jgi:predicted transcriptional regulator
MEITISSELVQRARELAQAEGLTVEAYVERLIREDQEWREYAEEPLDATDPQFEEVREAVMEGLEDAERGNSRPAADVLAELRAKHGLSS